MNSFILMCFIQFACTNLNGSQNEGFFFKFASERGDYPEWGFPQKRGVPTLEETVLFNIRTLKLVSAIFLKLIIHLI